MLPEELKTCQGLDEFKNSIKSWVPENCPCELCKTYIAGLGYTVVCEWQNLEPRSTKLGLRCRILGLVFTGSQFDCVIGLCMICFSCLEFDFNL